MLSKGQSATTWRARPRAVFLTLISQGFVLAAVTAIPAVFALVEGLIPLFIALLLPSLLFILLGLYARRHQPPTDLRNIEAICTFSCLFALITLAPVPAFYILGMPLLDALFEASSGTTSTGLSVAANTIDWPLAGHVLRGWLQWVGGFAIALAGVATIIGPRSAVQKMGQFNLNQRDILTSTRLQARNLMIVYCSITLVSFAILLPVMPSWWEAFVITLSAVSTGGFAPRADSLASYSSLAQVLVILICLSTTVSMLFYVILYRDGLAKARKATTASATALTAVVGCLLVIIIISLGMQPSFEAIFKACLNFLSGFTTAGFSVDSISPNAPLTVIILAIMLIGGAAGSTAGGLKIDRAIILFKMLNITFIRLRSPAHAIIKVKDGGKWMSHARMVSLAAVLTCYVLTLLIAWLIFVASGQGAMASLFEIISALSTVGLSTGITGADMPAHLKVVLICAMLLGRLEFLALLVTLSPYTWKKRT